MTALSYFKANIKYFWRTHLILLLALAVCTAVLMGAFLVGSSLKTSLTINSQKRLGHIKQVLIAGDRFISSNLIDKMNASDNRASLSGIIHVLGTVKNQESQQGLNQVQIYGIKPEFGDYSLSQKKLINNGVYINSRCSRRLNLNTGDTILIKLLKQNNAIADSVMSRNELDSEAIELKITGVLEAQDLGDFNLKANQISPYNLFIPLEKLQELLEKEDRVNMIISQSDKNLNKLIDQNIELNDLELSLNLIEGKKSTELRSSRIFMDDKVKSLTDNIIAPKSELFTYLCNNLNFKNKSTPYPLILAYRNDDPEHPFSNIKKDEIILVDWTKDDLKVEIGDTIGCEYFNLNEQNQMLPASTDFKVVGNIPTLSPFLDKDMLPDYPGLKDSAHCREWDVGFIIDTEKVRDKDEAYWDTYKGRPKAIISLKKAEEIWGNRYGSLTALRFQSNNLNQIQETIKENIKAKQFGLFFINLEELSTKAIAGSMDFSGLFIGFSFFICIAAVSLCHLLFRFQLEERTSSYKLMYDLGFKYTFLKNQFLSEFIIIAIPGLILGTTLAQIYSRYLIQGLNNQWQDAIGNWNLAYHLNFNSMSYGLASALLLTLNTLYFSLRKIKRISQNSDTNTPVKKAKKPYVQVIIYFLTLISLLNLVYMGQQASNLHFFILGFLLLSSLICIAINLMTKRQTISSFSQNHFLINQLASRKGRSLAVISMLSVGSFLMIALEVFRIHPNPETHIKSSGAGGFQIMASLTQNLNRNLNDPTVQKHYGLNPEILNQAQFDALRVSQGEDASCLNLNRAQRPNLIGINSLDFHENKRFSFMASLSLDSSPWLSLKSLSTENTLAVIGDQNALLYSLGKSIGDSIQITNEKGEPINLKIIAGMHNSIFQDSLLCDAESLLRHFPSIAGFQNILITCPESEIKDIQNELHDGLELLGADLVLTSEKMMSYNRVQNAYISIFQNLGLLGLALGCSGLCLIIINNMNDRIKEFELLYALGQSISRIKNDLLKEHSLLFCYALIFGSLAGIIATYPILMNGQSEFNILGIFKWLIILLCIAFLSLYLGYRFALNKFSFFKLYSK